MRRASNRQPRRGDSNAGRPRGNAPINPNRPWYNPNRGRGQAHVNQPRLHRDAPPQGPVPPISAIQVGTAVSIILKQDQPTGRQVAGIVQELLTRGDHPRGVKVQLRDGRVGRVQKVIDEEQGLTGEELAGGSDANLGRDGEGGVSERGFSAPRSRGGRGARGRRGGFTHVEDVRDDEYMYDESRSRETGYFAALEAADAQHAASRGGTLTGRGAAPELASARATCPVCGGFEGDEAAVSAHVETHFQD